MFTLRSLGKSAVMCLSCNKCVKMMISLTPSISKLNTRNSMTLHVS